MTLSVKCGGRTGAVGEPTPGPHLPEEVGPSRGVRQYIRLRGGARLFPLMYAGRPRDNIYIYIYTYAYTYTYTYTYIHT